MSLFDGGYALREEDVSVFGGFTGHNDGEGAFGFFIEIEAIDKANGGRLWIKGIDGFAVGADDAFVVVITFDGCHHEDGIFDEKIEDEEREDGFEEGGNAESIGSDDIWVEAFAWEMGVTEDDGITVSHSVELVKKIWAEKGRDAFEHGIADLGGGGKPP